MTSINHVSQVVCPERIFTHSGISYKSNNREIIFSPEAKEALIKMIVELQESINLDDKSELIAEITTEVGQAVIDGLILQGKWKQKVDKFMKRFTKAIEAPKKMSKKEEQKVTRKVEKYANDPYIHLYIMLENGERLPIPLIIRKESSVDQIFHSFFARNKISHFH